MKTPKKLADMYLEFVNDWLTVERFAEHYGYPVKQAIRVLEIGKALHEERVRFYNKYKIENCFN